MKQKILTIIGTRPEIIRLSIIMRKLDVLSNHHILHTGQNFDPNLHDIFFSDLGVRLPDVQLNTKNTSLAEQIGIILKGVESEILSFKPDKVLILGDTNSGLGVIVSERMGVPVFHLESGNRCFDKKCPEERNRKIIDHSSSFNLPYTPSSRENLIREGIAKDTIFTCGNPIWEVINNYMDKIDASTILNTLQLERGNYVLVTSHRAENVDIEYRLNNIIDALKEISKTYKVVFSCHPRTKQKFIKYNIFTNYPNINISEPFGFFDFVKMEKNAKVVLSDSGTVMEETCLLNVPAVIIRETAERPETGEVGANMISGLETKDILKCFDIMVHANTNWTYPIGYRELDVSDKIMKFMLGK